NITVNTSGAGILTFPHQHVLSAGVINQGGVDLVINAAGVGGGFCYRQNGGTFNGSANSITANANGFGAININGGTFNGGSGDINLFGAPADSADISLQGGTFKSTSGTMTVPGNFRFQGVGTQFLHNNGTVNFTAVQTTFLTNDSDHLSITFNNLNINLGNGVNLGLGPTMIANGSLNLNDGTVGSAGTTIEAQGPVVIGPNFDGGPRNLRFAGLLNQTFANNGGVNPGGTWTINKPFGIVTSLTNLLLQSTQPINILSGGLYLGVGSSFTSGSITIGGNGKLLADSVQTMTLGGDVSNSGLINLHANGTACPAADSILLRSSVAGTRRNWLGPGVFRAINVDVQDMGGTTAIRVFNGTNTGNN